MGLPPLRLFPHPEGIGPDGSPFAGDALAPIWPTSPDYNAIIAAADDGDRVILRPVRNGDHNHERRLWRLIHLFSQA